MSADRRSRARAVTVIADNGGGITLQITDRHGRRWQHHYYGTHAPAQLAYDLCASQSVDLYLPEWEGDETSEGWLTPTGDEQRNGGYRVYDGAEVLTMTDPDDAWGRAMGDLVTAILALARGDRP
jgi:hypothetical protein